MVRFVLALILLLSVVPTFAFAKMQSEINHLLNYVKSTECQYERNGTFHQGPEAAQHITKKYKYYEDDIESTEDFIKLSATKSTISGKHYQIHCEGAKPVKSKDWLLKELAAFRKNSKDK